MNKDLFKKEKNILVSALVITCCIAYFYQELSDFSIMTLIHLSLIAITIYMLDNISDEKKIKNCTIICIILNLIHFNFINMTLYILAQESVSKKLLEHSPPNKKIKNNTKKLLVKKEQISDEARKIDILLKIGVFLVILSGVIFSTSNTGPIIDIFKPFFILILSLLFYGLSYVFKTKVKIKKSEDTYYILSNIFLIFFAIALAYFKTFGEFLSFRGEGEKIVYSLIILLSSIITKNISVKYNQKSLSIISYLLIYLSITYPLSFFGLSEIIITSLLLIISLIGQLKISEKNTSYHESRYILTYILAFVIFMYNISITNIETLLKDLLSIGLLACNLYLISKERKENIHKQIFALTSSFFLVTSMCNIGYILMPKTYINDGITNIYLYASILSLILHHLFVKKDIYKYSGFILTTILLIFNITTLMSNNCNNILFIVSTMLLIYSVIGIYKNEDDILQKVYFVFQIFLIGLIISSGKNILKEVFNLNIIFQTTILIYLCTIALIDIIEDKFITKIKMDLPLYYTLISSISLVSVMCMRYNTNILNIIVLILLIAYRIYVNKHIKNKDIINCIIIVTSFLHIEYLLLQIFPSYTNQMLLLLLILASYLLRKDKITSVFCIFLSYIPLLSIINIINISYELEKILTTLPLLIILLLTTNIVLDMPKKTKTILETIMIILIMLKCIFDVNIIIGLFVGILALIMIFIGTKYDKYNSLFNAGIIVLILNIIVQLHEYWEKIPWFVYTLIAGLGIIFYVTYKEFNKDKKIKIKDTKIEYYEEKEYNTRNNIVTICLFLGYFLVKSIYFINIEEIERKIEEEKTIEKYETLNLDKKKFYFSNKNYPILYIIKGNSTDLDEFIKTTGLDEIHVCWTNETGIKIAKENNNNYRYYQNCLYEMYYADYDEKPTRFYSKNGFNLEVKNENLNYLEFSGSINYNYDTTFNIEYNNYETDEIEFCLNKYNIEEYIISIQADYYEQTNKENTCFKAHSEYGEIKIIIEENPYYEMIPSTQSDDILTN